MQNLLNMPLYTFIGDSNRIADSVSKVFADIHLPEEMKKRLSISVDVHKKAIVVDLPDEFKIDFLVTDNHEEVTQNTRGMQGFYSQNAMSSQALHQSVLTQIQLFNCIVAIKFLTDDNEDKTNFLINTVFDIAKALNAFIFMPDAGLYTGTHKLLVAPDGSSDFTEFHPIGNSDFFDTQQEEAVDTARKQRSLNKLKANNIPYTEHLPVLVTEKMAKQRGKEEIAQRVAALFAVSVYSEIMCSEHNIKEACKLLQKVDKVYQFNAFLSPQEKAYLEDDKPEEVACINHAWRYEACAVLLWALGHVTINAPDQVCDVAQLAQIMRNMDSMEDLIQKSQIQGKTEILDEADLTLRYDWACVNARIQGQEAPTGLDGGIVYERHYAFNWLLGVDGIDCWDDVSTNT